MASNALRQWPQIHRLVSKNHFPFATMAVGLAPVATVQTWSSVPSAPLNEKACAASHTWPEAVQTQSSQGLCGKHFCASQYALCRSTQVAGVVAGTDEHNGGKGGGVRSSPGSGAGADGSPIVALRFGASAAPASSLL